MCTTCARSRHRSPLVQSDCVTIVAAASPSSRRSRGVRETFCIAPQRCAATGDARAPEQGDVAHPSEASRPSAIQCGGPGSSMRQGAQSLSSSKPWKTCRCESRVLAGLRNVRRSSVRRESGETALKKYGVRVQLLSGARPAVGGARGRRRTRALGSDVECVRNAERRVRRGHTQKTREPAFSCSLAQGSRERERIDCVSDEAKLIAAGCGGF